jgi:hypothetical protein
MIHFDRILVAPTPEQLDDTLRAALAAVNDLGWFIHHLGWPLSGRDEFDNALASCPEGEWTWTNLRNATIGSTITPHGPDPEDIKILHLAWWSDFLQRRHFRVLAQNHHRPQRSPEGTLAIRQWLDTFPLLQIYPEAGFEVGNQTGFDRVLVVCPCGVAGTPAELGWMGTECGPCHDLRTLDALPPRPWDRPAHEPEVGFFTTPAFHPTRPVLALQREDDLRLWDFATNEVRLVRLAGEGLAWSPDGEWLLLGDTETSVRLVRADFLEWADGGTIDLRADELHFSLSGRWLVGLHSENGQRELQVWDWPRRTPTPASFQGAPVRWTFSADERLLYVGEHTGEFHRHDLEAGTASVLPVRPPQERVPLTSLHLSPDEASLVLGSRGTFWVVDRVSGEVRHSQHVPEFESAGAVLQSGDRRTLVGFDRRAWRMHLLWVPGLLASGCPRLSLAWYGAYPGRQTTNGHWLAVGGRFVRLLPWPPLLDWYTRTPGPVPVSADTRSGRLLETVEAREDLVRRLEE